MNTPVLRSAHEKNRITAAEIRSLLDEYRVCSINVMGGAGCGKTTLLEHLLPELQKEYVCAVLEGDIATALDAQRIAALGSPVVQLETEGACHLDATLVSEGLLNLPLKGCDFVFVENVGNLVCPAEFDIGEHARIAVLSVSEGHDKPCKHPLLFTRARTVVISKMDLLEYKDFDLSTVDAHIRRFKRFVPIFTFDRHLGPSSDLLDWISRSARGDGLVEKGVTAPRMRV